MFSRIARSAPWLMVAGNVLLLLGLRRDAVLHAADPTLAVREGLFSLDNGGHVLLFAGIGLITLGGGLFLAGRLVRAGSSRQRRIALALPIAALVALALSTANIAASSDASLGANDHAEDRDETTTEGGHDHDHDGHGHDHNAPAGTPTATEQAAADRLVAETLTAAARFEDFAVAEAEGFVRVTPYVLRGAGPAHFVNPAYAADGVYLDQERPEALVYLRTRDGEMHLLGVMYLAPLGQGPTPGGPLTHWHGHEGLCTGPDGFGRQDETGACPPGQVAVRQEMLHVWTFGHPDGPLAEELGRSGIVAAYRQLVW